ncbi:hypothetical protein BGX31_009729 [Mortierella sp. GBA43]|nr:hypothetical protein BGX31_009729 [Mortierella sp. GBA43]
MEGSPSPNRRTPKKSTSGRSGPASLGRASPFKSSFGSSSTGGHNTDHDNSTHSGLVVAKDEKSATTTPVYPESSVLRASGTSNAKLHLSDIQPIDRQILERIKDREISLDQHRDTADKLQDDILATQQKLDMAKGKHEQQMEADMTRLTSLRYNIQDLNTQYQKNDNMTKELLEAVEKLEKDHGEKDAKLAHIMDDYMEMVEDRARILQERDETDKEGLEYIRKTRGGLMEDYRTIARTTQTASQVSEQLLRKYGPEKVEALKDQVRHNEERIAELLALVDESENAMKSEEMIAEDLKLKFEKVYDRRTRSHTEELEEKLKHAEKIEKKRNQEANAALDEFLRVNQLAAEAEEKASREEFNILVAKEELDELKLTLQALRMDLEHRRNAGALATT